MKFQSVTIPRFWELYDRLPSDIQARAEELWSVRVTDAYRVLALFDGNEFTWVWTGTHDEYQRIIG